jgi:hypothetical protein
MIEPQGKVIRIQPNEPKLTAVSALPQADWSLLEAADLLYEVINRRCERKPASTLYEMEGRPEAPAFLGPILAVGHRRKDSLEKRISVD